MSATTGRARKRPQNGAASAHTTGSLGESADVLTLSEAARYLRVEEGDVLCLADRQELPGRRISGEWRFLKAALQDWLRNPPGKAGKEALLALAGVWKDDPDIDEIVQQGHRRRGRLASEPEQ